jgi:ketosteroid isomerase-like protein
MNFHKVLCTVLLSFCSLRGNAQEAELYRSIVKMDSSFFHAYNTCDLAKQAEIYADRLEFFHDKSGLDTSRQRILENTKKYICGKVTRELVQGSIEVSPLPGYGAVEVGMHMFHNNLEEDAKPRPSRFIIVWNNTQDAWKITKVISLH